MRQVLRLAVLTAMSAPPVLAQGGTAPAARASTSPRALEAVYQRFLDAIRLRDTLRYRDVLTADYRYVGGDSSHVLVGRAARIAFDRRPRDEITEFVVERCDLAMRPTVAVGPCWFRETQRRASDGASYEDRGVSLTTFVLDGRRWRIAATRPSSVPSK